MSEIISQTTHIAWPSINEEIKAIIAKEHKELADNLEHAANMLHNYIYSLRGEFIDMTGVGLESIFITALEMALKKRIIFEHYD